MDTEPLVEPVDADPTLPPPEPPESGSLSDHEAAFSNSPRLTTEADEPEPAAKPERHRAASQQATTDDVAAIAAQTKRLREAEAAIDIPKQDGESERVYQLRRRAEIAERAKPRPAAAVSAPSAPAVPPRPAPVPPTANAKPNPQDPKYADGVFDQQFIEDLSAWKAEQLLDAREAKQREVQAQAAREAEGRRTLDSWRERVAEATVEHPDFKAVALDRDTPIPQDSLVDRWIWEHRAGAKVLYHLHSHESELAELLRLSPLDQIESLTLLAQRLSPRTQAAPTGSAAAPSPTPAPRPPNPVRTGPIRTTDEPPGDGSSLAEHERAYSRPSRR